MKKLLAVLFLLVSAFSAFAQWGPPAAMVSVNTNSFGTIDGLSSTNVQLALDWIDDNMIASNRLGSQIGWFVTNVVSDSLVGYATMAWSISYGSTNYLPGTNIVGGTYASGQWTITPASIGGMAGTNIEGAVLSGNVWTGLLNQAYATAKTEKYAWWSRNAVEDSTGLLFSYTDGGVYNTIPWGSTNGYVWRGGSFAGRDLEAGRLYIPEPGRYLVTASVGTYATGLFVYVHAYTNGALGRRNQALFFSGVGHGSSSAVYDFPATNGAWLELAGTGAYPDSTDRIRWIGMSVVRLGEFFIGD